MTDHIARLRAFAHWFTINGGHMTEETRDALTLLADYDALRAAAGKVLDHRDHECGSAGCMYCRDYAELRNLLGDDK